VLRVSGKHNDLDEVGRDTYHHTFFEMLGNWSFGDYFKAEAIEWAWEFLVRVCGLPGDRLWATYFGGDEKEGSGADDEARLLWPEKSAIPPERVLPFGKKDNFWEMGDTGPCGPCSEIHIDLGEAFCTRKHQEGHVCRVNGDCARFIELWNLVFIQFDRKKDGILVRLAKNHVDTGMGFERLVATVQGTYSNYETDLFYPIFEEAAKITGFHYKKGTGEADTALRVVADHLKAGCFAIADGAVPEKKGRGSVLRSILRRAARFGRQVLDMKEPFIYRLAPVVAELYRPVFPELGERLGHIELVIKEEELAFAETLDRGLARFCSLTESLKEGTEVLDGFEAYRLYHQDGFPRDLIDQMARERSLSIDEEGWKKAEEEHRERSKGEAKEALFNADDLGGLPATEFLGYRERNESLHEGTEAAATALRLIGEEILLLDRTPFYAESGGQVGDRGIIEGKGFCFEVKETKKTGDYTIHRGTLREGKASMLPLPVTARVDHRRRKNIMANHTATHLLHWALRETLGPHATQQGSEVSPEGLRFDVTHPQAIKTDELETIESLVNGKIIENSAVGINVVRLEQARREGVTALFGEKYGQWVRVIDVGGFSRELCGGTHCARTGDIGYFYLTGETSSEAGVRRIEAITREAAMQRLGREREILKSLSRHLSTPVQELPCRVEGMTAQLKEMKKEKAKDEIKDLKSMGATMLGEAPHRGEVKIIVSSLKDYTAEAVGELADFLRSGPSPACGVLALEEKESIVLLGFASKGLTGAIHIGNLVKDLSKMLGGGGGGRPDFARGGGKHVEKLGEALDFARNKLQDSIRG
jgi:alanyl-tRNA synthetase